MENNTNLNKFKYENFKKEAISFLKDVAIIVVIVILVRQFFILPFKIIGTSMADSYYNDEFVIVDRLSYRFSEPKRGDVIVFKPNVNKEKEFFIKRIIGIPGDKLKIEEGGVYIFSEEKGEYVQLIENYLSEKNQNSTFINGNRNKVEYEIPEGKYFVMGDNRNGSSDSRTCFIGACKNGATPYTDTENIIGKVWIDLGYFNFKKLKFMGNDGTITYPRFFSSPSTSEYDL